ncbi:MAG TPA: TMEM175 family protein [Rhodanobacteraceae bacterium]|nr:TMEM175 family protein [Rhodanobacteraceae bacterium]
MTTPTVDHGFRIRGTSPTRVDAFVDAAFAFAVTLLVISIGHVPQSVSELVQALRGAPAFAASFYIVSRFWLAHRSWSRHYGIEDAYGVRLSLALVFLMLVYVYPLRMVAELTLASFSGGWLEETPIVVHTVTDLRTIYVVFGIGYTLTAAIFVLLHRHALDIADELALTEAERIRTRTICRRWLGVIALSSLSVVLALILPMGRGSTFPCDVVPGFLYLLLIPMIRVIMQRERRELGTLAAAGPAT